MSINRITYLLEQYLDDRATDEEKEDLAMIIQQPENASLVTASLEQLIEKTGQYPEWKSERLDEMVKNVLEASHFNAINPSLIKEDFEHSIVRKVFPWKRVAVAASIVLMIGLGSYSFFFKKPAKQNEIVKTIDPVPNGVIAPAGTKAMITLANGERVLLDSVTSGTLVKQGGVSIIKTADGQIVYNGSSSEAVYNTLYNPKGSMVVNLTLSDGTKVWLNSESSLKYPIAFVGAERKVEVTGEAYFEVTKDVTKKFIVTGNGVTTEVLGTHFNVNTYADESNIKVTLLEGSVKVAKGSSIGLLKPGQQAQIGTEVKVVNGVDMDGVLAWKNGLFSFNMADIKTVMRQVGRWYDVEVVYIGTPTNDVFGGDIQRDLPLSKVLDFLQKSQVHFNIEGKKLTVMP